MTDDDLIALLDAHGLRPGVDWRLLKVDGKVEIMISPYARRVLAKTAPDREKAQALVKAFEERFPDA